MIDLKSEMDLLKRSSSFRYLRDYEPLGPVKGIIDGRPVINFSSNDYLGFSHHPLVKQAAKDAVERYGTGGTSSRLLSGNFSGYRELEEELAELKGAEAALVFSSGYMTNIGVLSSISSREDIILADRLSHASLIDSSLLSRARFFRYRHLDHDHLEVELKKSSGYRRRIIVTDSIFSMDGDIAPLKELSELAKKYDAVLVVDDAHGTGVLPPKGDGSSSSSGIDFQIGTLSKALGSVGGFVAGKKESIELLTNKARTLIYNTALPPSAIAAAIASIKLLRVEPFWQKRLKDKVAYVRQKLVSNGFSLGNDPTPIIPILLKDNEKTNRVSRALLERGFLAPAIRPPSVPEGTSRIRITISAHHTHKQLDDFVRALSDSVNNDPDQTTVRK